MTTRRGFIQGVLVAIGAAVMPNVAWAEEMLEVRIGHGSTQIIDNVGVEIDMDALNASARNAAGAITEQAEAFDAAAEKVIIFTRAVTQARIDEYTDQGFTVLVTGWEDDN